MTKPKQYQINKHINTNSQLPSLVHLDWQHMLCATWLEGTGEELQQAGQCTHAPTHRTSRGMRQWARGARGSAADKASVSKATRPMHSGFESTVCARELLGFSTCFTLTRTLSTGACNDK